MDEEQQYESFHMDKDFEGLVEVGGEFMFRWVLCWTAGMVMWVVVCVNKC